MTSFLSLFNWDYLAYQFSTTNMTFIFHFDDVVILKFSIKGDNALIFHICVLCLWDVTFFQNMNLHDNVFWPLSRLLSVSFSPNFNML